MPDMEKVIKAFGICDNNEDGIVCKNCPYKENKWNGAWEDETGKTCFQTLHADVLALLKEQEKLINELLELGYPHNFQHEAPWVIDYLYSLTEIIKKAFKAKESR